MGRKGEKEREREREREREGEREMGGRNILPACAVVTHPASLNVLEMDPP